MNRTTTDTTNQILENEKYKKRLQIALKAARICVFEVDIPNQLYTFFENAEDIFGVSGDVILNDVKAYSSLPPEEYQKAVSDYFSHPDDYPVIKDAFHSIFRGQSTTYEARMKAGGSGFIWCKLDVTPIVEDGVTVKMIGVITDISVQKLKTDGLTAALQHDSFTGLYTKSFSIQLIQEIMHQSSGQTHALLLLDIDNFKNFNDTYGHAVGDTIIKLVADTLRDSFRKTDIVGRFGGDEFIVFIQDIPDRVWLTKKLQQLMEYKNSLYTCTTSIGVAFFPGDSKNFSDLFQKADAALYHSKQHKRLYTFASND